MHLVFFHPSLVPSPQEYYQAIDIHSVSSWAFPHLLPVRVLVPLMLLCHFKVKYPLSKRGPADFDILWDFVVAPKAPVHLFKGYIATSWLSYPQDKHYAKSFPESNQGFFTGGRSFTSYMLICVTGLGSHLVRVMHNSHTLHMHIHIFLPVLTCYNKIFFYLKQEDIITSIYFVHFFPYKYV